MIKSRQEFNEKFNDLFNEMRAEGEHPIVDFCKRSIEEQHRLWRIGRDESGNKIGKTVTNCDGHTTISYHQYGRAIDLYFLDRGKVIDPKRGYSYWHDRWDAMGGRPRIEGDLGHFEG